MIPDAITNPHVIMQPVHVRRAFHRMQSDGTMYLLLLEVSGERLGPAAVVIKNRLHLCGIITSILWASPISRVSNSKYDQFVLFFSYVQYILIISFYLNNFFLFLHVSFPFLFNLTNLMRFYSIVIKKSLKRSNYILASFLKRDQDVVLITL